MCPLATSVCTRSARTIGVAITTGPSSIGRPINQSSPTATTPASMAHRRCLRFRVVVRAAAREAIDCGTGGTETTPLLVSGFVASGAAPFDPPATGAGVLGAGMTSGNCHHHRDG